MEVLLNPFHYGMHGKVIVHTNYQEILLKALKMVDGTYTRALTPGTLAALAPWLFFCLAASEAEASSVSALLLPAYP